MLISEIFYSIQGEGELMGMPSVFVRTSGCNLRCIWCDTPYSSWDPQGKEMAVAEIIAEVKKFSASHVVITGGEPLLAPSLAELTMQLKEHHMHITVETAATIFPDNVAYDLASISPKLKNSLPGEKTSTKWRERHQKLRYQPEVLKAWIDRGNYQLKFVVASQEDIVEIQQILMDLKRQIPPQKVFLMPEAIERETLSKRAKWIIGICQEKGYRYCHRLHIELFGNSRGT